MTTARPIEGLHHITAIAGPAQENFDFYAGILGMRLVKRSVNQDDPGTYHLFYADAEGHPGTDLTFFPWAQLAPSRPGTGLSSEVSLTIAPGSLDYWSERLARFNVRTSDRETRFGLSVLPLQDPHGLRLALVETPDASRRSFTPWPESSVEPEHQIRGLESARMVERSLASTADFLTGALGLKHVGTEGPWHRYATGGGTSGAYVEVAESPSESRGAWGTGSVHHIAWRVADDAHEQAVRTAAETHGAQPTPVIDRFWFKSVYFREPGGVLFELATDGPGFAVDEEAARLGETLVLPPWLEKNRVEIEKLLPPLRVPVRR